MKSSDFDDYKTREFVCLYVLRETLTHSVVTIRQSRPAVPSITPGDVTIHAASMKVHMGSVSACECGSVISTSKHFHHTGPDRRVGVRVIFLHV